MRDQNRRRGAPHNFFTETLPRSKPMPRIHVIWGSEEGRLRQRAMLSKINPGFDDPGYVATLAVNFFTVTQGGKTFQIYPASVEEAKKNMLALKVSHPSAVFVCDDNSLRFVMDRKLAHWLLPVINLVAFGFKPDLTNIHLPQDKSIIACPVDAGKAQICEAMIQQHEPEENNDSESIRALSIERPRGRTRHCRCLVM